MLTLELELSRAEVKKLVAKLKEERKDHVNYRALTDVEVGAPEKVGAYTVICILRHSAAKENWVIYSSVSHFLVSTRAIWV